jgi:hypothetical protein
MVDGILLHRGIVYLDKIIFGPLIRKNHPPSRKVVKFRIQAATTIIATFLHLNVMVKYYLRVQLSDLSEICASCPISFLG